MRKTDISCRRCGYKATVEGKPPERCPGCSVGTKPEAVLEFEERLQRTMSQLMWEGMQGGWPIHKLKWRKYPNNDGRIDLMFELQRLATIRCTFDGKPEVTFRWVGPEHAPLTAAESVLLGDLEKAKAAQDATSAGNYAFPVAIDLEDGRQPIIPSDRAFSLTSVGDIEAPVEDFELTDEGPSAA